MENPAKFTLNLYIPDTAEMFETRKTVLSTSMHERMLDWNIEVHPCPYGDDSDSDVDGNDNPIPKKRLSVFLCCTRPWQKNDWPWSVEADFKITLMNLTRNDYSKSYEGLTFSGKRYQAYHGDWKFIDYDKLGEDGYVLDGCIQVQVEVILGIPEGIRYEEKMALITPHSFLDNTTSTGTSLHFLESGEGSNLTIVSSDGVEFKVHKGMLAKKSDVFTTMFEADMTEAKTGVLELKDMDSISLKTFLRYVYTGDMTPLETMGITQVTELINASEKYGLADLKEYCGYLLVDRVTPQNALALTKFAMQFNLKKRAQKDIRKLVKTNFDDVWEALSHGEEEKEESDSDSSDDDMDDDGNQGLPEDEPEEEEGKERDEDLFFVIVRDCVSDDDEEDEDTEDEEYEEMELEEE